MIAETVLGRGERAFEYWKKIAPAYLEDESEVHRLEPYVYAQMIAGKDAIRHGEAKNSWLTGTAAWNFVAISQHLLGIRPDYDVLLFLLCIGAEINRYTVTLTVPRRRVPHPRREQRPGPRALSPHRRRQADRRRPLRAAVPRAAARPSSSSARRNLPDARAGVCAKNFTIDVLFFRGAPSARRV